MFVTLSSETESVRNIRTLKLRYNLVVLLLVEEESINKEIAENLCVNTFKLAHLRTLGTGGFIN